MTHACLELIWSGNIINFNVGASVDLDIPRSFWSRLAGKYGNIFYWKDKVKFPSHFDPCFVFLCKWFISKLLCLLMHETGRRRVHWSCCNGNIKLLERTSGPKQLFRGEIVPTWIWLPASDNMLQTPCQSFVTNYVTHFGAVLLRM